LVFEELIENLVRLDKQVAARDGAIGSDIVAEAKAISGALNALEGRVAALSGGARENSFLKITEARKRLAEVQKAMDGLGDAIGYVRKSVGKWKAEFALNIEIEGAEPARAVLRERSGKAAWEIGRVRPEALRAPITAPPAPTGFGTASALFVNSMGMKFVRVPGATILISIWETRVQDFKSFRSSTNGEQNHPVVNVSWEDAKAFCEWLSQKEGKLYRLPTDHEWSLAAGIGGREIATASPSEKNAKIEGVYPWGTQWPPPQGAGNFASGNDYSDAHLGTAPVGSYHMNGFGGFDLSGNVWEWCEDWYDGDHKFRVLRGGSWCNRSEVVLQSSSRLYVTPTYRHDTVGFRVALEVGKENRSL